MSHMRVGTVHLIVFNLPFLSPPVYNILTVRVVEKTPTNLLVIYIKISII